MSFLKRNLQHPIRFPCECQMKNQKWIPVYREKNEKHLRKLLIASNYIEWVSNTSMPNGNNDFTDNSAA